MTFEDALKMLQSGANLKRTDWGYPNNAYIKLEQAPNGHYAFYMYNEYENMTDPIGYGLTYQDVISIEWTV